MRFRKLRLRLRRKYRTVNLIESIWDDRYEYDNEISGNYKPKQFLWMFFKALILKRICWNCNGYGMTGYYEPEACNVCQGYGINWTGEKEPDWEAMVEGMRKYE